MKKFGMTACAMVGFIAGIAQAADNRIYAGISLGNAKTDLESGHAALVDNNKDTGWKLIAGIRPVDWLGAEVSYVDLGTLRQQRPIPDATDYKLEQSGFDAFGVAYIDIAMVDLFAKAGVVRWKAESSFSGFGGPVHETEHGTDFAWGVGAQLRWGSLAARLEFERFEIDETPQANPQLLSVGLTWTFL